MAGRAPWITVAMESGMPTSWATTVPTSGTRALRASPSRSTTLARSSTEVRDHSSNAARAAVAARSTSTGPPSGTDPMASSVAALPTSITPSPAGGTQEPPMKRASRTIMAPRVRGQSG